MFVLVIYKCVKAIPASEEAWQQPLTRACEGLCSFPGSCCSPLASGRAPAAVGRVVSSRTLSFCPGCTSRRIPLGAAGAGRSGAAV